jgi:hypothetical protein
MTTPVEDLPPEVEASFRAYEEAQSQELAGGFRLDLSGCADEATRRSAWASIASLPWFLAVLVRAVEAGPHGHIVVTLDTSAVRLGDGEVPFDLVATFAAWARQRHHGRYVCFVREVASMDCNNNRQPAGTKIAAIQVSPCPAPSTSEQP